MCWHPQPDQRLSILVKSVQDFFQMRKVKKRKIKIKYRRLNLEFKKK